MAFNQAQYNLNPFNIAYVAIRNVRAVGSEYISPAIGSAMIVRPIGIGNERVISELSGAPTRFATAKGTESINEGVIGGQLSILLYPEFYESISGEYAIAAYITPDAIAEENITHELDLTCNIYLSPDILEEVNAVTDIVARVRPTAEGFELVSESASLVVIDSKTCVLNVTLAPGHQLIIDADSYTVLLDGQNAIELQSGDWIDELDRSTTNITIKASSGAAYLSGKIIYTERYL